MRMQVEVKSCDDAGGGMKSFRWRKSCDDAGVL